MALVIISWGGVQNNVDTTKKKGLGMFGCPGYCTFFFCFCTLVTLSKDIFNIFLDVFCVRFHKIK